MAFFEDIGKKVSQTSQDAIKKTKIIAETAKINAQISGEKKIIGDNFSKIGEKYFQLFSETPDENLAEFVTAIKEAKQKIDDFEEQIKRLKGTECCPTCGAEIKDGAIFCTACGTKLEIPPVEEKQAPQIVVRVCSNCGSQLPEGSLFCSSCGTKAV